MGRTFVFGTLMAVILLIAAAARSDVAQPTPTPDAPDPDPNNDLSTGEKAWVDRNRDTTGWDHINNGFAQAAKERVQAAIASDAATQLGVEDLANEGVAP
jgi:hypothetical protein